MFNNGGKAVSQLNALSMEKGKRRKENERMRGSGARSRETWPA